MLCVEQVALGASSGDRLCQALRQDIIWDILQMLIICKSKAISCRRVWMRTRFVDDLTEGLGRSILISEVDIDQEF